MIDALLGLPLAEAVDRLPVSEKVRGALLGEEGVLTRVFQLAVAWERQHGTK